MNDFGNEYLRFTVWLHPTAAQAEGRAERANRLIRKVAGSGLRAVSVILGRMMNADDTSRVSPPRARGAEAVRLAATKRHPLSTETRRCCLRGWLRKNDQDGQS